MLLAVDLHEDFVYVVSVSVASMCPLQYSGVNCFEFYAPKTYRFTANSDASFSENILDVSVTQIESVVEPDSIGNDIGWKSVMVVSTHPPALTVLCLSRQNRARASSQRATH